MPHSFSIWTALERISEMSIGALAAGSPRSTFGGFEIHFDGVTAATEGVAAQHWLVGLRAALLMPIGDLNGNRASTR